MSRDNDAVLCGHCLALCLIQKWTCAGYKSGTNKATIRTWKSCERLNFEWAKRLQFFLGGVGCHSTVCLLMGYSRLLPLQSLKNTNTRESVTRSQRLSMTLRYLGTGSNFEDMKFINKLEFWCWIPVYWATDRQAVTGWILRNTVHKLFSILRNVLCQISDTVLRNPSVLALHCQ